MSNLKSKNKGKKGGNIFADIGRKVDYVIHPGKYLHNLTRTRETPILYSFPHLQCPEVFIVCQSVGISTGGTKMTNI